uniref:HECT domain-containing protein n=1 Tax=viral metagenome TaxID=1070528 RepID=A0A6C0CR86_9ZZZZ
MTEASTRLSARPSRIDITDRDCIYWQENPTINPRPNATGLNQPITPTSQPYKTYQKNCFELFIKNIFNGINPLEQLEKNIKDNTFLNKDEFNSELNSIKTKIEFALNNSVIPINEAVKIAYLKYITDIKNKLEKIIDRNFTIRTRATRQPTLQITPTTSPSTLATTGFETSFTSNKWIIPKNTSIDLTPYMSEIQLKTPYPKYKLQSVRDTRGYSIINDLLIYVYKYIIKDENHYEPNYNNKTFISNLTIFMYLLISIDVNLIRYEYYHKSYKTSIHYVLKKWKHIYGDNFDYISSFKNALLLFLDFKLSKAINKINPRADTRILPLTENEWQSYISMIKLQMIYDLELEDTFDRTENHTKLIQNLNSTIDTTLRRPEAQTILEVYEYTLRFILTNVDYNEIKEIKPRQLIYSRFNKRPSLQKSNEVITEIDNINLTTEDILDKCKLLLSNVHTYYKSYQEKMQQKCSELSEKCINLNKTRKLLISKYPIRVPIDTSDKSVEDINIKGINREIALATLFKKWNEYKEPLDKQEFWLRYFNVSFKGEEGVFIGPGRELIQVCLEKIQYDLGDVFIPIDDSSRRIIINSKFTPSNKFLENSKIKEWNLEAKKSILQFLGGLFTRALLLNIEIPFSFSYYTISYLYYKNNIQEDTFGFYFLLDMPNASKDYFKLMEIEPETVEYVGLEFNDTYPLIEKNETITNKNLPQFINTIGKYILLNPAEPEYQELLEAFSKGFILKREFLIENGITIRYLDKLLNESGGSINERNLDKLINNKLNIETSSVLENSTEEQETKRLRLIEHQLQIGKWFVDILNTDGSDFPYEKVGIEKPSTLEKQTEFMLKDFLPKLFYFWTSSYNINILEKHILKLYESDILNKLPTAHTCVKTIDIPSSYNSYEELFEKLAIAVYNTQGFAFAGGMKNIIDKCIKKALKTNILNNDYNKSLRMSLITIIKCHKLFTKEQKKNLIKYIENEAIDFKNATKSKISQWSKQLCKQVKK